MQKNCVVTMSGGISSLCLLHWATTHGFKIKEAVWVDYNQDTEDHEVAAANRICEHYNVPLSAQYVNVEGWKGCYENKRKNAYVPLRNLVLLGIAASRAEILKCDYVLFPAFNRFKGVHPDTSNQFLNFLSLTIRAGAKRKITLLNPFENSEINSLAYCQKFNLPVEKAWHCLRGGLEPCGRCVKCRQIPRS